MNPGVPEGPYGPWMPIERARALRTWSAAQRRSVQQRLAAMHRGWCIDWIPPRGASHRDADGPDAEVVVTEPGMDSGYSAANGDAIENTPAHAARWFFSPQSAMPPDTGRAASPVRNLPASASARQPIDAIAGRMFARDAAGGAALGEAEAQASAGAIASKVAHAAWAAWLQRISATLAGFPLEARGACVTPAASVVAGGDRGGRGDRGDRDEGPWSGALRASWPWCGGVWHLLLPHGAVAALLGEPVMSRPVPVARAANSPEPLSLDQALTDHALTLNVMLTGAVLSLEQLQGLRPGDIVPLAHALAMPAQVLTAGGAPVCDAWLGQSKGRIAIELAVAPPSPEKTSRI